MGKLSVYCLLSNVYGCTEVYYRLLLSLVTAGCSESDIGQHEVRYIWELKRIKKNSKAVNWRDPDAIHYLKCFSFADKGMYTEWYRIIRGQIGLRITDGERLSTVFCLEYTKMYWHLLNSFSDDTRVVQDNMRSETGQWLSYEETQRLSTEAVTQCICHMWSMMTNGCMEIDIGQYKVR